MLIQTLQIVFISLTLASALVVLFLGINKRLAATRFASTLTSGFYLTYSCCVVANINFSMISLFEISNIINLVFALVVFIITLFYFIKRL